MNAKPSIKIELTPEEKEQRKPLTEREFPAIKLTLEELEQRLAPGIGTSPGRL